MIELNSNKQKLKLTGFAVLTLLMAGVSNPLYADQASASEATMSDKLSEHANSPSRSQKNRARNQYRHPVDTLNFFGIKDDMTVVEVSPGSGAWYTEILAPYLRDNGTFYAASYNPDSESKYQQRGSAKFNEKMAANPDMYDKVVQTVFDVPNRIELGPDGVADMVLTFRNFHGWAQDKNELTSFNAMYKVLKPGGVLGVVQHRMNEDTDDGGKPGDLGYVKASHVISTAEQAGFELVGQSEVNANSKDTKDHAEGVWTLPPVMALKEVDADKYRAIGESDRMTLKFVRPL